MKNSERSIRVIAVNNYSVESKFDIYLEFSGKREWLMMHRHNGILYNMLKHGVSIGELKRFNGRDKGRVQYLLRVIDEYLEDRESA